MKIFKDRKSAGLLLAQKLKNVNADFVLGIPRGGVVVANEIAEELKLPLDIVVVRKIGAPWQSELALGALDPDGEVSWEEGPKKGVEGVIKDEWKELKRREDLYRSGKPPLDLKDKTVILTDDGMATGATTLAAVSYLKRHGAKVILTVPVASENALEKVKGRVEKLEVLEVPEYFEAVGQFYQYFPQVLDEEVIQLLS